MSGGSYNYLCFKEVDSLFDMESNIEEMADRLAGLGYAEDAARETHKIILLMRQYRARMVKRLERMQPVWKAVEWWDSSDWGEDDLVEELARYRGEKEI